MGRRLGLALVLLSSGSADCRSPGSGGTGGSGALETSGPCEAPLVLVSESMGAEAESLPVIAMLEEVAAPVHGENLLGCGAEYGNEDLHRARLGPLAARYRSTDYKGQSIASNVTLSLFSPACPDNVVSFTMAGPSYVRLRRDPAHGVYVVTGGILQNKAIAVRTASPAK